jgi:hypothetical protein
VAATCRLANNINIKLCEHNSTDLKQLNQHHQQRSNAGISISVSTTSSANLRRRNRSNYNFARSPRRQPETQ